MQTRRQKVVAVVAGVLVAGACLFAFNYAVQQFAVRKGYEELQMLAERNLALSEQRLTRLVDTLDDLQGRGHGTCHQAHLQILEQTALSVPAIKELAVVAADGHTECTTVGPPGGQRMVLSSHPILRHPQTVLEVVSIGDAGDTMLRIRRLPSDNGPGLAVMIPGSRIFSHRSERISPESAGVTRAEMGDGTRIGQNGKLPASDEDAGMSMSLTSANFGIQVTTTVSKLKYRNHAARLQILGSTIFGCLIMVLLAIAARVPSSRQRDNPIAELERALAAGEFVPYYQPIVDIATGNLRGAEVLVRWRKPDGSTVSPGLFIPLAESSGIILEMTRVLMHQVCRELGPAFAPRQHLKVCFNLAARHFQDDNIIRDIRDIRDIFGRSPIRLSQVVLELTERQPIDNLAETRRLIAALQALGVRIALDDVGTGHSGLSYILKLGVDIIKIDKIFVDAIGIDRSSTTIIETLIDLAHNMRMEIVAEGVETFEQVVCLRDRGVRAAQGFVFAPALPGSSFLDLIAAADPVPASDDNTVLAVA